MSELVKGALIVAAAILLAAAGMIYFSPYQSCVQAYDGMGLVERGMTVCAQPNSK